MNYRDIKSTQATINSYMEAFNKMRDYCQSVEPSCNESNQRVILPADWRFSGGYNELKFRNNANFLNVHREELMELFGSQPKLIKKGYRIWDMFFTVSLLIKFPFDIYAWECAVMGYTRDDGKEVPYKPAKMVKWCSPQYLTLGVFDGWGYKHWGLSEWWVKHQEIETFLDNNPILKDQYRAEVAKADAKVKQWQTALKALNNINIPE